MIIYNEPTPKEHAYHEGYMSYFDNSIPKPQDKELLEAFNNGFETAKLAVTQANT